MGKRALIIGATGGVGGAVSTALLEHGWQVRAIHRNPEAAAKTSSRQGAVEWVKGDAMNAGDVIESAKGADLIFNGANPPGYKNWRGLAIPMLSNAIEAAKVAQARLVFPGNVYNFGPDAGPVVSERSPENPVTRKGAIRVEMEGMLKQAARDGVRSFVVRAGDFFGLHAPSSWLEAAFVKPGKPIRSVTYPGAHDIGHAWAYLPDLGETIARLAEREAAIGPFEVFHFGGHYLERGVEIAEAIKRVAGVPDAPIQSLPWAGIYLLSPFNTMMREMLEMRYLWKRPLKLDDRKLVDLLGRVPHTPLDEALRTSLEALGCLRSVSEKRSADRTLPAAV